MLIKEVEFTRCGQGKYCFRGGGMELCVFILMKMFRSMPRDTQTIWVSLHTRPSARRYRVTKLGDTAETFAAPYVESRYRLRVQGTRSRMLWFTRKIVREIMGDRKTAYAEVTYEAYE